MCKKRFVVDRSEAKRNYCDDCQLKINKEHKEENK